MRRWFAFAAKSTPLVALLVSAVAAHGAAPGVQVSVLTTFPAGQNPTAVAATNTGDVVALAGVNVVNIGPTGKQKQLQATVAGGAFGTGIGIAYDNSHRLVVALPGSFGPPAQGTILSVSANGKQTAPVPGSQGMVAPDGFGLDSATGDLYATDIYGSSLWRIGQDGVARLWTSVATNPLLVFPDGVKVYKGAVFVSIEAGAILRIPINADGTAGVAQIWAQVPGAFFDDLTLDDRNGNVYVSRLDTNELLQITPAGVITPIVTNADGLLGAANMVLIHVGQNTVIYLGNTGEDFLGTGATTEVGPAILKITIPSPSN